VNTDKPLRPILYIGRIGRAHGLRGETKVLSLTSDPARFKGLEECLLVTADEKVTENVAVEYVKVSSELILIKLQGVDTREQAEKLNGRLLAVKREQAVRLPADTWFVCDLVGCAVYGDREGYLGQLAEIIQNTAQDVYIVRQEGQNDLLFPALKSILLKVDIAQRRIDVRLPEGLYEVYRERKT
jgi:16S rRNA processing protein RimM